MENLGDDDDDNDRGNDVDDGEIFTHIHSLGGCINENKARKIWAP